MDAFQASLLLATLLCSLVAGFLFAFAVVVMPGLRALSTQGYLEGFQALDRVIQENSPAFGVVWGGSVLALLVAAGLGFGRLEGSDRALLVGATALYLLGVQLPTFVFNIPLNNRLQAVVVAELEADAQEELKAAFETRWVRSNTARTLVACLVSGLLLAVLLRI